MYKVEKTGLDKYKVIEDETGNTVAHMAEMSNGWWAWDWQTGEALLRGDFEGQTLEEVLEQAPDWI